MADTVMGTYRLADTIGDPHVFPALALGGPVVPGQVIEVPTGLAVLYPLLVPTGEPVTQPDPQPVPEPQPDPEPVGHEEAVQ